MRIFVFYLLLASISSGPTAFASEPAAKKSKAEWSVALYGRSTDDDLSSARVVGVEGLIRATHELSDSLSAIFVGGILLETGSSASLFTDEFAPTSRILLHEASLNWQPWKAVALRAGALYQSDFSPLLIDGITFPASKIELSLFPQGPWVLKANGQAAIPTSQRLATKSTGKEATPALFTQTAHAGWQSEDFTLLGRFSHFDFRNLTHGMAQDSRFYGNSIVGVASGSTFLYQYEGYEAGLGMKAALAHSLALSVGVSGLRNQRGPVSHNQGTYGYVELNWQAESFALRPRAEVYRDEADAAPAFYTSSSFGHNNRKGTGLSLKLDLKDPLLTFEIQARESKLIQPATFQRDKFKFIELSVGIPYAGF
ncbi:MAG: hypothetical protein ACXWQO_14280 [Bdellovibrionota bacterium]